MPLPSFLGQAFGTPGARTSAPVAAAVTPQGVDGAAPSAVAEAPPAKGGSMTVPLIMAVAAVAILHFLLGWGWIGAIVVGAILFFLIRWWRK